MYIKLTGALLIIAGCGGYGMMLAGSHRREVKALHELVLVLDRMICELEYRMTPLPDLCRFGSEQCNGPISSFLRNLAEKMDEQVSPDVGLCIIAALKETNRLPSQAAEQLRAMGQTMGRFDLRGQLASLEQCKQSCLGQLDVLEHRQTERLRSYQTLGFCAGAALAILLF